MEAKGFYRHEQKNIPLLLLAVFFFMLFLSVCVCVRSSY